MELTRVWLEDFRNYASAEVELAPRVTAVVGANGQGKSNLLEAVGWLGGIRSFRGAPTEALIRAGADRAIVRGEADRGGRSLLLECEINRNGRNRTMVNRQPVRRARDAAEHLRSVSFAPEDLELVKGGPSERRRYLDDLLAALHPRFEAVRNDLDRILRQRAAVLKQSGGRTTPEIEATLDVWDARLAATGEALADGRIALVAELSPAVAGAYRDLAGDADVGFVHAPAWRADGLVAALRAVRRDELRRGVGLVGPQRDDVEVTLNGLPARTHASQGEQRTLALALRLAAARRMADRLDTPPLLLLDDVFSELDDVRAEALMGHLPAGQTVITTAGSLPPGSRPDLVVTVVEGRVVVAG